MRTPVTVVTGVDPDAMASVMIGLAWDLPEAVTVHHRIDPEAQILTRTVSDASGVLEREHIEFERLKIAGEVRESAGNDDVAANEPAQQMLHLSERFHGVNVVEDQEPAGIGLEPIEHGGEARRVVGGVELRQQCAGKRREIAPQRFGRLGDGK